jgi:hypothetical protein
MIWCMTVLITKLMLHIDFIIGKQKLENNSRLSHDVKNMQKSHTKILFYYGLHKNEFFCIFQEL